LEAGYPKHTALLLYSTLMCFCSLEMRRRPVKGITEKSSKHRKDGAEMAVQGMKRGPAIFCGADTMFDRS
jgi:hypothetical protein